MRRTSVTASRTVLPPFPLEITYAFSVIMRFITNYFFSFLAFCLPFFMHSISIYIHSVIECSPVTAG